MKRNEESLRDLWGNIKCMNILTIGISGKEKRYEKIFKEILVEFSNKRKEFSPKSWKCIKFHIG